MQIIGKSEVTFLRGYSAEERRKRFEDLFCYEIPALVISRNLDVFPECLEMAQKHGRTLLRTKYTSVEFTAMTIDYLNHTPRRARRRVRRGRADLRRQRHRQE